MMNIQEVAGHLVGYLRPDTAAHGEELNQRHKLDDRRATVVEALFRREGLYEVLRYLLDHQHDIPKYNRSSPLITYIEYDKDELQALEVGLLAARAVQQLRRNQSPQEPIRLALTQLGLPQVDWVSSFSVSADNPWVELLRMLPNAFHASYAHQVAHLVEILTLIDPMIREPEFLPARNRSAVSCPFPLVAEHADPPEATLAHFVVEVGVPARVLSADNLPIPLVYPHPQMLLNTGFDDAFLQSVQNAFERALRDSGVTKACIRWHLRPYYSEETPTGRIEGSSVGVAATLAMRRLLEGGGSLDDREVFTGGMDKQGNIASVEGIPVKSTPLTRYPELHLNVWQVDKPKAPADWLQAQRVRTFTTLDEAYQIATGLTRALRFYLNKTADALNTLPLANLTIEQVFVEPRLQIRKLAPQPRPDAQPPTERSEDAREAFPTRDYWEEEQARLYELLPLGNEYITETVRWKPFTTAVLSANARQALVGAPGSGKTTATKAFARQLAQEALQQMAQGADLRTLRLPLWVRLSEVKLDADAPLDALLTAAGVPDGLRAFYREMLQSGRVVVFLDGLDELDETREIRFKRWLQALLEAIGSTPVLLTCRTLPWEQGGRDQWAHALGVKEPYELAPLNLQEQEAFIRKFFADDPAAATRLRELMQRNFALRHTARTYLLATIIALLHRQHQISETTTYAELYELFWLETLRGRWKEVAFDWSDLPLGAEPATIIGAALRRVLTPIGFYLFQRGGNRNDFHQADWERAFLMAQAEDPFLKRTPSVDLTIAMRLYDLLAQVGLISKQGQRFFFNHLSFLEYLAGAYLARLSRDEWEPILRGAGDAELVDKGDWGSVYRAPQGSWWWFAPEYAEAIAFMASAMENATPLLEAIEAEERKYPREVFRHLLVHKARVAGYGKVKEEKRNAILQEVLWLYLEDEYPLREYLLPALRGLGCYASNAVIDHIRDVTENEETRIALTNALAVIGSERAIEALIQLSQDTTEDVWMRVAAVKALNQCDSDQRVNFLTQLLQRDTNARVRLAVVEALGTIGSEQAVNELLDYLQDKSEDTTVRRAVAWALVHISSERVLPAFIGRLRDKVDDTGIRRAAVWALGQIGGEQYVNILTERLRDRNENVSVRCAAAEALGKNGGKLVLDTLIKHLRYRWENRDVRYAVARALGMIDDEQARDALIQILQDRSEDMEVRGVAAGVLVYTKNEIAVNALIERLRDRSENVYLRCLLTVALKEISTVSEQAANALIECLQDQSESKEVRRAVAETLGCIKLRGIISEPAVDVLIERLQDRSEDKEVRCKIAKILAQFENGKVISALTLCWKDTSENSWVRFAAGSSLPRSNDISDISNHLAELRVSWQRRFVYRDLLPICRKHRFIAQHSQRRLIPLIRRLLRCIRRLLPSIR